ncbi:MAG: aldose 1-epimerase family protein [candidate division KSB1 bacterium]|nr:aldose 1-epimerase family protein [candidate division KSB1 bacterium]
MELYGQNLTKRELEARLGRVENHVGLRRVRLAEGPEAGVELIWVRTGGGLSYFVNPSRALDIGLAEFCGVPFSWHSVVGEMHPALFEPRGTEWLRTAPGGLLITCGLTQVGAPCVDQGEELGLHGRVHHTAARQVGLSADWDGDEYHMTVSGMVEEARIFGENLRLRRQIRSQAGRNCIRIDDRVENVGFAPVPHMILYHFNFGFPLLSEQTTIHFPQGTVRARDEGVPVAGFDQFEPPLPGYRERVYYHELEGPPGAASQMAEVTISTPRFPVGGQEVPFTVHLRWDRVTLPCLVEWKMPAAGVYALGIEPANCHVEGRAMERARGTLQSLQPGETRHYHLEVEVELRRS